MRLSRPIPLPPVPASMSEREMLVHYKATAVQDTASFYLATMQGLTDSEHLTLMVYATADGPYKPAIVKDAIATIGRIRDRYMTQLARQAGPEDTIGTPEWFVARGLRLEAPAAAEAA